MLLSCKNIWNLVPGMVKKKSCPNFNYDHPMNSASTDPPPPALIKTSAPARRKQVRKSGTLDTNPDAHPNNLLSESILTFSNQKYWNKVKKNHFCFDTKKMEMKIVQIFSSIERLESGYPWISVGGVSSFALALSRPPPYPFLFGFWKAFVLSHPPHLPVRGRGRGSHAQRSVVRGERWHQVCAASAPLLNIDTTPDRRETRGDSINPEILTR